MKKMTYKVEVQFGATSGGFEYETNDLKEVEKTIKMYQLDSINRIVVYDRKIEDFIYWKDALCYKPEINLLGRMRRDFRFKERHW